MLMEIEDFKNNNGKNNTADRNIGTLDSKIKRHDIIPTKAPDNRYFVQREGIVHAAVEKLSPPKMKRRVKDLLNEQNNTKNSQTTDFSKKVLPEVHKDCNCGSPKNGKGSSSSSSSIPLKHDHTRSASKSRDEVHKCSPNSNKNINRQHRTDQQQQHQQSKAIPQSQSIDNEPIHMSWDEVMQEAKMLGIPLKSQNKLNDISNQRVIRTGSEKSRQGKNFYSDGDDCNRINNRQQDTTSVASSASSIGLRHAEHKRSERSPQTFKGIIKLQNFFKKLELRHKSPCHCQSNRNQKVKEKRESSPRSFLREVLMPQKIRDHGSGKMVSRSHNTSKWDCEECMKKCKYCRSIERMSLKEKSSRDDDEVCSISMIGSWQPETSFDQLSLPIKSSSLNRNSKNISYQGSCYSLSSKSQHVNFSSRSFNAEIGTTESDISLPDPRGNEKEQQNIKTVKTVPKAEKKLIRYDINPQDNLRELKHCLWYWGSLDRESANEILRGMPDGSYLLRNSSDDRYVLALSFRSQGVTHHTGIEYSNGHYTFHERSPPIQPTNHRPSYDNQPKENIVCFIEKASNLSKSESDRYYLQPRSSEEAVVPVKLWTPMLRPVESLRNLATDIVVGAIGKPDFIANLPVIATIKRQVKKRFQTKVVK